MTGSDAGVTVTVTRGPETWAYIYTVLGFVLTIESTTGIPMECQRVRRACSRYCMVLH
jgi:hypothetical protein